MILFAAHDPGAKNHIRPLYKHVSSLGYTTNFIDLSAMDDASDERWATSVVSDPSAQLLVCGCSVNQSEWVLLRVAKRLGIQSVVFVEIGVGERLDQIEVGDFPDRFLVTNQACAGELVELGVHPENVFVTGSTHLELLSMHGVEINDAGVRAHYHLSPDGLVVSFFSSTNQTALKALSHSVSLLAAAKVRKLALVVRPHPRCTELQMARLEQVCRETDFAHFDPRHCIDTPSLLASSAFSLTMGSTVSLESIVLGTPSAFFQIGWDYVQTERIFRNVPFVQRVRNGEDFRRFAVDAMEGRFADPCANIENHKDALERSWEAICQMLDR